MKQGTEYEIFVEQVYQLLKEEKKHTIRIERNLVVKGISGANHEIDVYWEFLYDGKVYKTAIECKDYSTSAISKGKIQEFYGKLIDLPEKYNGIFATKLGYQKGAKIYADTYNIDALLINELTEDNFPDGYIKQIEIYMHIIGATLTDVKFDFDVDWIKTHYDMPFQYSIKSTGYGIQIEDKALNFSGSLNEYINNKDVVKIRKTLEDNKSSVTINIIDGYIVDSFQKLRLKVLNITYIENHYINESSFTVDGMNFAFALIKRVSTGEFIFVSKK